MPKPVDDPQTFIAQVRLLGRSEGRVKLLAGFRKQHHTVPDAVNSATQAFLAKLCQEDLSGEAEALFQKTRDVFAYKRRDLSLEVATPLALLRAKDFTWQLDYALSENDPADYVVTRALHDVTSGTKVYSPEFDEVFAGMFSTLSFTLTKNLSVESVIDAVEDLEGCPMRVDYPSDCRQCTLSVEGVEAEVVCDGGTLEMCWPRTGSPRELVEAFAQVRKAFALSKHKVLRGLLG